MYNSGGNAESLPMHPGRPDAGRILKRTLHELLGSSEGMISPGVFPSPGKVHDIRVNMKKGRAILKLLKKTPGAEWYRRENVALRDISALFSSSREADVLQKTIKLLERRNPVEFAGDRAAWLRNAAREAAAASAQPVSMQIPSDDARERLRRAWYRTCFLDMNRVNESGLLDGLWDSFLRAGEAFDRARSSLLANDIHELRKRVKDLLYQVGFFRSYNPIHFDTLHSRLDVAGSALGKCNDVSVLWTKVLPYAGQLQPAERKRVEQAVGRERTALFTENEKAISELLSSFYSGNS